MFNSNSGYSLSDIAAVTDSNNRNNSGFGDGNGAWWIIILFLFVFCGWGGNGFGGGFGNNRASEALTRGELCQDMNFADLETAIRGVNTGLCDGFYTMNTGMLNGFSGLQNSMNQGFAGLNTAITTNGYETRLGTQNLASQLAQCCCDVRQEIADCCCKTQSGLKDISYNIATGNNAIQNAMCLNTRDIIDNQNANYRALHDEIVANRIEDKNAQIQAQQNQITALQLAASQERQNNYLISELRPCPIPAYPVANPFCCNTGYNGLVYSNSCGC